MTLRVPDRLTLLASGSAVGGSRSAAPSVSWPSVRYRVRPRCGRTRHRGSSSTSRSARSSFLPRFSRCTAVLGMHWRQFPMLADRFGRVRGNQS